MYNTYELVSPMLTFSVIYFIFSQARFIHNVTLLLLSLLRT